MRSKLTWEIPFTMWGNNHSPFKVVNCIGLFFDSYLCLLVVFTLLVSIKGNSWIWSTLMKSRSLFSHLALPILGEILRLFRIIHILYFLLKLFIDVNATGALRHLMHLTIEGFEWLFLYKGSIIDSSWDTSSWVMRRLT